MEGPIGGPFGHCMRRVVKTNVSQIRVVMNILALLILLNKVFKSVDYSKKKSGVIGEIIVITVLTCF